MNKINISREHGGSIIVIGNPHGHYLEVVRDLRYPGDWFRMDFVAGGHAYQSYFSREEAAIKDTIKFYYALLERRINSTRRLKVKAHG